MTGTGTLPDVKQQGAALGELRKAARQWQQKERQAQDARDQRDRLIRAAAKAGVSYRQIAAALASEGVSINHQRVGQIVAGS